MSGMLNKLLRILLAGEEMLCLAPVVHLGKIIIK